MHGHGTTDALALGSPTSNGTIAFPFCVVSLRDHEASVSQHDRIHDIKTTRDGPRTKQQLMVSAAFNQDFGDTYVSIIK